MQNRSRAVDSQTRLADRQRLIPREIPQRESAASPRRLSDRDAEATAILRDYRVWAVVGLGAGPPRVAHQIAAYLQQRGKIVVPVHPAGGIVLGERVWSTLADIPLDVDVVDVFRRSELAGVHVDEAIAIHAKAVWLQLGVVNSDAVGRAHGAGLLAVEDACPRIDGPRLLGWPS